MQSNLMMKKISPPNSRKSDALIHLSHMGERITNENCQAALDGFEEYCRSNNFSFEMYDEFQRTDIPIFLQDGLLSGN